MSLEQGHHHHTHVLNEDVSKIIHSKRYVRLIDKMVWIVALGSPLITTSQVWQIYVNKSADDISLITWGAWNLFSFFWLAYGIAHRSKPIIINNILWIIIQSAVVTGKLIYG
jgi:uncharacterized protein with PQ loop repeat